MAKKKILLVEDHTILREGLKALLDSDPQLEVVAEAENGLSAVLCVDKLKPDLVLMDLSMPKMNGIEAIREIKKRHTEIKIVVLTVHDEEEYIHSVLESGAQGYVLKDANKSELILAIKNVLLGKKHISSSISEKVIEGYLSEKRVSKIDPQWETLSARERTILKMIAEGYKSKQIADYLSISEKTVRKHRSNIMNKLNLHSISKLTVFSIKKGLIN